MSEITQNVYIISVPKGSGMALFSTILAFKMREYFKGKRNIVGEVKSLQHRHN